MVDIDFTQIPLLNSLINLFSLVRTTKSPPNQNVNLNTVDSIRNICNSAPYVNTTTDGAVEDPASILHRLNDKLESIYDEIVEKGNAYSSNILEKGNKYYLDLIQTESQFFISKYGNDIYNDLIQKRNTYIANKSITNVTETRGQIIQYINVLNQNLSGNSEATNILNTYLPSFDSNSIYREIEYRDNEYIRLYQINFILNALYYIIFIVLIVLLIYSDKLLLKERFLFYLFLALLPFIYPWLFLFSRKIWNYIIPFISYNGPKNAFIDTNVTTTSMWSANNTNEYKSQVATTTVT